MSLGAPELFIIFLIVLVLFGPKALPQLGKTLGSALREFKNATRQMTEDVDAEANRPPAPPRNASIPDAAAKEQAPAATAAAAPENTTPRTS